jgi:hypothetical protein
MGCSTLVAGRLGSSNRQEVKYLKWDHNKLTLVCSSCHRDILDGTDYISAQVGFLAEMTIIADSEFYHVICFSPYDCTWTLVEGQTVIITMCHA